MAHPQSDILDRTFHALAHSIRRDILTALARDGEASVSDLAEPFDVSLMAVSKHLKVLTEAGLVHREKDGRVQRCSFDPESITPATDWLEKHRHFWEEQLDSFSRYLNEQGPKNEPLPDNGEEQT